MIQFLNKETAKSNDAFRNSVCGPDAAEAMCKEVKHIKKPAGKERQVVALRDLSDRAPMNMIYKVMLEGKASNTWCGELSSSAMVICLLPLGFFNCVGTFVWMFCTMLSFQSLHTGKDSLP